MKVMIKTELERAFKSWSLWLALIIWMGLSIAQIITRIIPAAMNPLMGYMPDNATLMPISAFQVWIGNGVSFEYSLFIMLFLYWRLCRMQLHICRILKVELLRIM